MGCADASEMAHQIGSSLQITDPSCGTVYYLLVNEYGFDCDTTLVAFGFDMPLSDVCCATCTNPPTTTTSTTNPPTTTTSTTTTSTHACASPSFQGDGFCDDFNN